MSRVPRRARRYADDCVEATGSPPRILPRRMSELFERGPGGPRRINAIRINTRIISVSGSALVRHGRARRAPMPVLFRREVPLRTIVPIQAGQARALQAPIRLAMLDLLAQRPMSVEDLSGELPAHGFRKATNTLRHHLEILVSAELVELAVLEQTRGAVLKYFAAS